MKWIKRKKNYDYKSIGIAMSDAEKGEKVEIVIGPEVGWTARASAPIKGGTLVTLNSDYSVKPCKIPLWKRILLKVIARF